MAALNRLRLLVGDFVFLCKKEWKTMSVILTSLSVSVGISVILLSFMSNQFEELYNIQKDKRTYDFFLFSEDSDNTEIKNFNEIFFALKVVSVDEFLHFPALREYAIVEDESFSPPVYKQFKDIEWNAVFTKEQIETLSVRDEIPKILKGRWFTKEEINEGKYVVVLDKTSFPGIDLDDMVSLAGNSYKVIGFSESSTIDGQKRSGNYIAYNSILSSSVHGEGFSFSSGFACVFNSPLKQDQLDVLARFSMNIRSEFDMNQGNFITGLIVSFTLTASVLFLVVANVYNLYRHLINKSIYRFMIYKLCGGNTFFLYKVIYLNSFILTLISCSLGFCIYQFILKTFFEQYTKLKTLNAGFIITVFCVVIVYSFIVLLNYVKAIVKMSPIDKRAWRD